MTRSGKKHIWVLSELYYPEDSATGYYLTRVAEGLASTYEVDVLCAQPTYSARGTRAPTDETHNNVRIHRCAATALNKDVLPFRLINLLTISVSIFFNAIRRIGQGDIVLVVTNPPTLPFVVFVACKLRGAKLILRIEDVFPEAIVAAGIAGPRSGVVRVLNALYRRLYMRVDRVIVLGRDMLRLVQSKIGCDATHVIMITNWADSDEIRPLDRGNNPLLRELGLMDKFVIQFSGNMGRTHGLESLLQCARILASEDLIHFLFIGSGAKALWLRKTTNELALRNVTILPTQPRSNLLSTLNACDLAVVPFVNGMAGVSVPSRMYNILSAGKPILAVADPESELARVVREENVGWVVKPESPDLIAQAVVSASAHRDLLKEMSIRARALVLEKYSLPTILHKYERLIESMGSTGRSAVQDVA